jgi:MFS family permease
MESRPPTQGIPPAQGIAVLGAGVAGMAIFVIPLVLGPVAMILGWLAIRKGEPRGKWVIVAAAVCIVLGLLLGLLPDKFVVT